MSGAAGHMNHLYDNLDLSFDEMFTIMKSASKGKLIGTEKLDGFNVFLGYSGGVAKAARSEKDIASGGMDLQDLMTREWKGGDAVRDAYTNALKAFDMAINSLSLEERLRVFGENGEKFYNAELLHPDTKNIVSYDGNVISIHRQGHKQLDPETDKVIEFDPKETDTELDKIIDKFEKTLSNKDMPFHLRRAAVQNLKELENKEALNVAVAKIKKVLIDTEIDTEATVKDYLKSSMSLMMTDIPEEYMQVATARMLGDIKFRSPEVNNLPRDVKAKLSEYWKQAKPMYDRAIYPIELAIHEYTVEMLKGMQSAFILDNSKELQNVKEQVDAAIEGIKLYISQGLTGSDKANEILTKQLDKLKNVDKIDTVVEGFVFEHDGALYKFTGNFAPINQILGLWKWGRGKQVPPISQSVETEPKQEIAETPERTATRIAVVPGGYKPPHSGHFLGATWFLDPKGAIEPADQVHVLISPKERYGHSKDGRDGRGVKVTKEMAKALWEMYVEESGLQDKIKISITNIQSPVQATYEFMSTMQPGQTLIVGMGTKDREDHRFNKLQEYSENKGYGVNTEIVTTPMLPGGVDGTTMRRFIADDDYESFAKHVPLKEASAAWELVKPKLQSEGVADTFMPFLHRLIEEVIAEKAKSKNQQQFMGMVKKCQDTGDCSSDAVKKAADSMTKKAVDDYASTKHKGLPEKVKEESLEEISAMSVGSVEVGGGSGCGKKEPYDPWDQSEYEKELVNEFKQEMPDVIELEDGLGLSRAELPQIKSTDVPEFMEWLQSQGTTVEQEMIDPKDLTPIQKEINLDKVAGMVSAKGLESLASSKPVMISEDNYLIDGHHRWYALWDSDYPEMLAVKIGLPVEELISTMTSWDKSTKKDITSENIVESVISYLMNEEASYDRVGGKYILDLKNMSVVPTKHGEERRFRHKQGGKGMAISKQSIVKAIDAAVGDIMNDFVNGELANDEPFHIRAKQGKQPALNIVGVLNMQPGPDALKIITVMRKEDFKTDSFGKGGRPQRQYDVKI